MKEHLIVDVANSFHWSSEDKDNFVFRMKEEFSDYKCAIFFTDSEETTFQLLGKTQKVDKDVLKSIIYLKDMESELKNVFNKLKYDSLKCYDMEYLKNISFDFNIDIKNLLCSVLALHKEYVLNNLEDKPKK